MVKGGDIYMHDHGREGGSFTDVRRELWARVLGWGIAYLNCVNIVGDMCMHGHGKVFLFMLGASSGGQG